MDELETDRAVGPGNAGSRVQTLDVVLVNYRSAGILAASLGAMERFSGGSARFIVVDNSPGDGAAEVVESAIPNATIISNPMNVGFAAAVNQGIQVGTGELVLLLNPDVTEIRGRLETIRELFIEEPSVAALAALLKNPDGTIQRLCRTELKLLDLISAELSLQERMPWWASLSRARMPDWDYLSRREVDVACGAWLCLRRAAIEDVGPFDERFFVYWEETDWLIRAKRKGWKTVFVPEIEVIHSGRSSSGAPSDDLVFALRGALVGFDSARWIRSLVKRLPNRPQVQRRLAVHLTGHAPSAVRRTNS